MFWKGTQRKEDALLNLEWNYTNLWNLGKSKWERWTNLVWRAKEARKGQNECEVTRRNRSSCVTANRKPFRLSRGCGLARAPPSQIWSLKTHSVFYPAGSAEEVFNLSVTEHHLRDPPASPCPQESTPSCPPSSSGSFSWHWTGRSPEEALWREGLSRRDRLLSDCWLKQNGNKSLNIIIIKNDVSRKSNVMLGRPQMLLRVQRLMHYSQIQPTTYLFIGIFPVIFKWMNSFLSYENKLTIFYNNTRLEV